MATTTEHAFPAKFSIGFRRTGPFVDITQLKAHLALLNELAELRSLVDGLGDREDNHNRQETSESKDRRWIWFLGLAVERFTVWCQSLKESDTEMPVEEIWPPLDVIMVWHAYMLNPGRYAEDCTRIPALNILKEVGRSFLSSVARVPQIPGSATNPTRVSRWTSRTSFMFNPLEDAEQQRTKTFFCPKCCKPIETPFANNEGTGYLQEKFSARCPRFNCSITITKATLAVRKFAEDLVLNDTTARSYLAGTLHTAKMNMDVHRAMSIKGALMNIPQFQRPKNATEEEWVVSIMKNVGYDRETMKQIVANKIRLEGGKVADRMFGAYEDGTMFSVELVGAVTRQGSFVEKMAQLRWTEPDFFDNGEDEVALLHGIARYHAFLDLMVSSPSVFYVPTLDIDLAWHTHQLMAQEYNNQCRTFVKRFIDHDDKVGEDSLKKSFEITCLAWKDRFGVQYTHCGCPRPGENAGQRLSRLVGPYASSPSYLLPPKGDHLPGTHPSQHDIALITSHAEDNSKQVAEREKRKRRREWGGVEQATAVEQQKRDAERKEKAEEYRRQREAELTRHRPFIHSQRVLEQRFHTNTPAIAPALTGITLGADYGGSAACTSGTTSACGVSSDCSGGGGGGGCGGGGCGGGCGGG